MTPAKDHSAAAAFIIAFCAAAAAAYLIFFSPDLSWIRPAAPLADVSSSLPTFPTPLAPVPIPETHLSFVGDIMLDRSVRKSVEKNFGGDYGKLFEKVGALKESDILFGNLEGPLSDKGRDLRNLYSFRFATSTLPVLEAAGFDALSIVNNHVGDWGKAAFDDTLLRLKASTILPVGAGAGKAEASAPRIIEKNGIRFGFIGVTDVGPDWLVAGTTTSGILLASDPNLSEIISAAASACDVLVVSIHWGVEYEKLHNARQEKIGHLLVDSGAKLVVGHHPHVVEDIEEYGDGLIAYSLGNFIFDQYFSAETMQGGLLNVVFKGKELESYELKSVNISRQSQPSL